MSVQVELTRRLHLLAETTTQADGALERIQDRVAAGETGPVDKPSRRGPTPRQLLCAAAALAVALGSAVLLRENDNLHVETEDLRTTTTSPPSTTTTATTPEGTTTLPPSDVPPAPGSGPGTVEGIAPEAPVDEPGTPANPNPSGSSTTTSTTAPEILPDGHPVAVRLVGPDYDVRSSFYIWEVPDGDDLLAMGVHGIPYQGSYWAATLDDPGQICLFSDIAGGSGTWIAFGQVRADATEVRAVTNEGTYVTATLGAPVIWGLRPWLLELPQNTNHYAAYDAAGNLLQTLPFGTKSPDPASCPVPEA